MIYQFCRVFVTDEEREKTSMLKNQRELIPINCSLFCRLPAIIPIVIHRTKNL